MKTTRRTFLACLVGGVGSYAVGRVYLWPSGPDVCPNCGPGKHVKLLQYGYRLACCTQPSADKSDRDVQDPEKTTRYGRATVFLEFGGPVGHLPAWRCDKCHLKWDAPVPPPAGTFLSRIRAWFTI